MTDIADPPITTLPDGTTVATPTLRAVTINLQRLVAEHFVATYELVQMCRQPSHKPFGNSGEVLQRMAFINADGSVHADTRAVVLASFVGDELDIVFQPVI